MSETKPDTKAKTLGDKIAEANSPLRGRELAAAQREDRLRALEEEKAGYKTQGKDDRVKAVDAEIRRLKSSSAAPAGRQAPASDEA